MSNTKAWSVTSRKMFHQCSVRGWMVCTWAEGPVTTQTWQATAYAEPTGTDMKYSEASSLSLLFPSKGNIISCYSIYILFQEGILYSLTFLLSLSSKMSILPAEWYHVRECLSFYILLPHTSLCMHLSLLSEAYIDKKRGEKSAA